jgi:hypothetical protein
MESFIMLVGEPVASWSDVSRSYGNCGPFSFKTSMRLSPDFRGRVRLDHQELSFYYFKEGTGRLGVKSGRLHAQRRKHESYRMEPRFLQ